LLKTVCESHFAMIAHPQPLSGAAPEYPLHPGAVAYPDRGQSQLCRELVDVQAKLITVWVFLCATCYAVRRYFLRGPADRFVYYLRELTRLDLVARGIADDPEAPRGALERVAYLEDKLSRLKAQMIQELADTKLYQDGAVGTVMSLIADTRACLNAQRLDLEGSRECDGRHAAPGPQGQAPHPHGEGPENERREGCRPGLALSA
jgi:hypothetical protein